MTSIMAIFEHLPPMQILVGGQNFSFPTLFDCYRELLLSLFTPTGAFLNQGLPEPDFTLFTAK